MIVSYKWLQEFFDEPLPPAEEVAELLMLHSFEIEGTEEIGEDTLIDVDVLPNRAHDCLSHRGIARELGSILGRDLYKDPLTDPFLDLPEKGISASVDDDVPNTSTVVVRINNISIKESPDWLKERLAILGQRSINNIVDITNYVMLYMGQPMHAFDAKVFADETLRIKFAEDGEKLVVLGGEEFTLTANDLAITDGKRALDIGGIRGGIDAEITDETTDIVLAVSHFDPTHVRKTAQRLKLWTDAAKRYQNDPSRYLAEHGAREAVEMILDLAGGEVIGMSRGGMKLPEASVVSLSIERANNLLGLQLSLSEVEDILKRIGCSYHGTDALEVTVPHERLDLRIEEDLIEEIGRLHGYDKLPELDLPEHEAIPVAKEFLLLEHIRDVLVKEGFSEVYTYVLRDSGKVKLINALNTEKDHLRTNLVDGLEEALELNEKNLPLLGREHVDVFEVGHVFTPEEKLCLGIASTRKKVDFENVVSKLGLGVKGKQTGKVFEIDLSDVAVDDLTLSVYEAPDVHLAIPSPYPYVLRDVAVWTPEGTTEEEVKEMIRSEAAALLFRIDLFDEFSKDGRTSYAYHLVFQSDTETLSDDEVNVIMERVYGKLREQEGFEIR